MKSEILIVGGVNDPNINYLLEAALEKKIPVFPFLIEENISPSFFWDLINDKLILKDKVIEPTAVFIRRDVFHHSGIEKHDRALAWYTALMGWIAVHTDVRIMNRICITTYTNKLQVLELAAKNGLRIPSTYVTNNTEKIKDVNNQELIAKPVMGGGYCYPVDLILKDTQIRSGLTSNPGIVQERIKGDDIRIYRVDTQYFVFAILTEDVDYRQTNNFKIEVIKNAPKIIINCLAKLMDQMGLNWGAADFKRCIKTGEWFFLEVNSNPMFSVFDRKTSGKISDAIFESLLKPRNKHVYLKSS